MNVLTEHEESFSRFPDWILTDKRNGNFEDQFEKDDSPSPFWVWIGLKETKVQSTNKKHNNNKTWTLN